MANQDDETEFVSGNERLARILSDPERCANVDAIVDEMGLVDRRYRDAAAVLDAAVAATEASVGTEATTAVLQALQRALGAAGAREVGITLTVGGHGVTVPLDRIITDTSPDRR